MMNDPLGATPSCKKMICMFYSVKRMPGLFTNG